MKTYREENYLKAIYQLSNHDKTKIVSATEIAICLEIKPPTVLEKLAILVKKGYVTYNKFDGAKLSQTGKEIAINIVRRHRIWETYLYKQLKFSWSEVHEIAEQLEHVNSDKLLFTQKFDLPTGISPQGIVIADVDADGKNDILVANQGSNTISIFKNSAGVLQLTYTDEFSDKVITTIIE